jgi:hypothetical protein
VLRANHYDAAFEEFLRRGRVPYVAVNETRRACVQATTLKSLDFVVSSPLFGQLLIDVKGRRAPHGPGDRARRWENWATQDDLDSMAEWEKLFGEQARALLVFAYWLTPETARPDFPAMLSFRGREYGFYGVWAAEYRAAMRVRSPRWETVWLNSQSFRDLRFPLERLTAPSATAVS